jgi:hypothetical protein
MSAQGYRRLLVSGDGPRLRAVTLILSGPWLGAEVSLSEGGASPRLVIAGAGRSIELTPFAAE